ncbi:uncharacterized protein LOC105188291 [Harpegnathos saltator]|uniref:uncharacterized protein LOC105188291 n=1 Tax=Harpegnathos saltator TaxID=610380 RepID=UPI00058C3E45|nr:uncharacterized protein LOC105188291 [Harpegnathos saltator]
MSEQSSRHLYLDKIIFQNNYNKFFHPNVCHVCKTTERLTECLLCRMISYCSEEHRIMHRPQHIDICEAVILLNMYWRAYISRSKTLEEWILFKKTYLLRIKDELQRDLMPYEEQMFLFAKSCYICHKQDILIVGCKICVSVNVCLDHFFYDFVHCCRFLRFCLDMDIYNSYTKYESIPENLLNINIEYIHDMQSFIESASQSSETVHTWSYSDYIHSDEFSKPLTLFHTLRQANLLHLLSSCSCFVIHIIIGSGIEEHSLLAWESILHQLGPNTTLHIEVVDPYLRRKTVPYNPQICNHCVLNNKHFQVFHYLPEPAFSNPIRRQSQFIILMRL